MRRVHTGLAADGAVHLSEKGRRCLDQAHAPIQGRRDKSGEIADTASS